MRTQAGRPLLRPPDEVLQLTVGLLGDESRLCWQEVWCSWTGIKPSLMKGWVRPVMSCCTYLHCCRVGGSHRDC